MNENPHKVVDVCWFSTEALPVARTIEDLLQHDASVRLWTSDTFQPGSYPLQSLIIALDRSDYAILVLTRDDLNVSRGKAFATPRNNVIFEVGLFMGLLGRHRRFLVFDKENKPKLPSEAVPTRSSSNLPTSTSAARSAPPERQSKRRQSLSLPIAQARP